MLYATCYSTVGCYQEIPFNSLPLNTICHLYKTSRPDRIHVTLLLLHRTIQVDNALKLTLQHCCLLKHCYQVTVICQYSISLQKKKKFSRFAEINPDLNDRNRGLNAVVISLQEYCYFYITKNKYVSLFLSRKPVLTY